MASRARAALAAAVLVALAACGGGGDDPTDAARRAAATSVVDDTATSSSIDGAGAPDAAGAPTAPGAGGGGSSGGAGPAPTTPTAGSGGAAPPPASGPRPAAPARAGRYSFDTDGTTQVSNGPPRDLPEVTSLTIDAPSGVRQRNVRDLRDQDGVGGVTEQQLDYVHDGVRLARLKLQTSFAGVTNTYEFEPAYAPLVIRTGPQAGDVNRFTLEGDGVRIDTTATVKRFESITVKGTKIDTVVLDLASTLSGELQGTQLATTWIDVARNHVVKEDVTTDVTSGPVRVRSAYVATIRSLTPS